VNHGYARNFLVPNQLALVVPRPRRGHRAAAAAAARSSSGAGTVARQQQAARSSGPLQLSLEKQQQQFDKLIKTLTGAPLVRGRQGG
jgi:ribosomal protein L9